MGKPTPRRCASRTYRAIRARQSVAQSAPTAPREVTCLVAIADIRAVRDAEQEVEVDFVLRISWRDPALAHEGPGRMQRSMADVWHPRGQVVNGAKLRELRPRVVEVAPRARQGEARERERARTKPRVVDRRRHREHRFARAPNGIPDGGELARSLPGFAHAARREATRANRAREHDNEPDLCSHMECKDSSNSGAIRVVQHFCRHICICICDSRAGN